MTKEKQQISSARGAQHDVAYGTGSALEKSEDREERIRLLKEMVQSGTYKSDNEDVARILAQYLDPLI